MPDYPDNSQGVARRSHLYLVRKQGPDGFQTSEPPLQDASTGTSAPKACNGPSVMRSFDSSLATVNQVGPRYDDVKQMRDRDRSSDIDEIWLSGVLPITLLIAIGIIHFTIFSVIWQSVPNYIDWRP